MKKHVFHFKSSEIYFESFCSPLNVFLSYYYFFVFSTLAMAPWLLGQAPQDPPKLSQAPPEPPLGRTGAREGFGSILERPQALKYDK